MSAPPPHPSQAVGYGRQFAGSTTACSPAAPPPSRSSTASPASPDAGRPALELGVGTGRIALPLAARSGPVVGVDGHPTCSSGSRPDAGVEPSWPTSAATTTVARYDLVYCVCGTLSMVLEPDGQAAVLEACARASAPGAAVVVETHDPAAVAAMHEGRTRESFFTPTRSRARACFALDARPGGGAVAARARVVRGRRVAGRDRAEPADDAGRGRRVRARRRARAGGALGDLGGDAAHGRRSDVRVRLPALTIGVRWLHEPDSRRAAQAQGSGARDE